MGIRVLYACCVLSWIHILSWGQGIPAGKQLRYETMVASLDTAACPSHTIAITSDMLVVAFSYAATHYPELCGREISLQYGSIKTSMAAQPRVWSLFRKRDKRRYRVVINKDIKSAQTQLLYAAPFDACVGVMGHELAHLLDYSGKSGWQMIWTGIRYLGRNYRRKMEHQTDSIAIVRGFGWQLYRYAFFVVHEAEINDNYRNYKLDIYMKPEEILEMVEKISAE